METPLKIRLVALATLAILVPLAVGGLRLAASGGAADADGTVPTVAAAGPSEALAEADAAAYGPLHGLHAVLYKSPTCGCCEGYVEALRGAGVGVGVVSDDRAVQAAKREHGVPPSASSCHTFTLGGYVVEGHVPLEALERLVTERPDADGLVLPGMPAGTPGMPGPRTGPIEVLRLDDGRLAPFATL